MECGQWTDTYKLFNFTSVFLHTQQHEHASTMAGIERLPTLGIGLLFDVASTNEFRGIHSTQKIALRPLRAAHGMQSGQ